MANRPVHFEIHADKPTRAAGFYSAVFGWQFIKWDGPVPYWIINSGGASSGESDLAEAVRTAVINKRAGGTGLISGRKAFQRPIGDGVALLHAIQDVYLTPEITIA
jgi:predicted enzyme related to lactoylglutathione lyase